MRPTGSEQHRRTPTEALSGSPGSTDFPTHPRANSGPRRANHQEGDRKSAAGEAAEALQFPRLDRVFRNISLGGPTALLISVMPSKSGQAAKRPSSAWIASGSHAGRWAFSPLESRKACGPQDSSKCFVYISNILDSLPCSTHTANMHRQTYGQLQRWKFQCHAQLSPSAAHIWTGWRGVVLPGNVPIGALTLLGEAAHFSFRGPIIKLKRRSPAGASWTPACFP